MKGQTKVNLETGQRRIFSEEFKKAKVKDIVAKRLTIQELSRLYGVSRQAVYNWLYQYSVHHQQKTTLVVQMESEAQKTKELLQRVAELERTIGQKQLEIDFLNVLLDLAGKELGFDVKKNFSAQLSSITAPASQHTPIK